MQRSPFLAIVLGIALYAFNDFRRGCSCGGCWNGNLTGHNIVVTGGSAGLGAETARHLTRMGARVILPVRSMSKGQAVAEAIAQEFPQSPKPVVMEMDLASFASVRKCAEAIKGMGVPIHALINNAGLWPVVNGSTVDGLQSTFQVNHLSHYLLTNTLLPALAPNARIINLSSGLHYRGVLEFDNLQHERPGTEYNGFVSYSNAKLANVVFTAELQRRLRNSKRFNTIKAVSLHPGVIITELHRDDLVHSPFYHKYIFSPVVSLIGKNMEEGVRTTLYAAVSPNLTGSESDLYLSDCAPRTPHRDALDPEVCRKLWELSEQLTSAGSPL